MPKENLQASYIDLKIEPQDPWAVIPADRRDQLAKDLAQMANLRRTVFEQSANKPLP